MFVVINFEFIFLLTSQILLRQLIWLKKCWSDKKWSLQNEPQEISDMNMIEKNMPFFVLLNHFGISAALKYGKRQFITDKNNALNRKSRKTSINI